MEIIRIGDNSLKISLCTKEADKYEFNKEISNEQIEKNFKRLLSEAKIRAEREKLIADIFSCKDGSCEIFISRGEEDNKVYKDKTPQDTVKKSKQITAVYSFDDFEKLLLVARRLKNFKYIGSSMLYYDEDKKKYYIMLDDVYSKDIRFSFVNEYSKNLKGSVNMYAKEHFKCICKKDAVKILSKF